MFYFASTYAVSYFCNAKRLFFWETEYPADGIYGAKQKI